MTVDSIAPMRIALVSPYSWTFPGGVTRHIDALAARAHRAGPRRAVLAPVDPDDRLTRCGPPPPAGDRRPARLRDPAGPHDRAADERGYHRGSHVPDAVMRMRSELRAAASTWSTCTSRSLPCVGWDACCFDGAPVVGTFHAYSAKWLPNAIARSCSARAASSTSCTPGSPSRRPPAGPASATSAATTR